MKLFLAGSATLLIAALFLFILIALAADFNYGAPVEYETGSVSRMSGTVIDTNKFVACYAQNNDGHCKVGTVSGTTITYGSRATFDNGDITRGAFSLTDTCQIDTNKFAVVYVSDNQGDDGYTVVGSVSGDTITYGTSVEFETGDMEWPGCAGIDTDKWAIAYNDESNSNTGKAAICTASGTTASCGTPTDFNATDYYPEYNAVTEVGTDKFVVAFQEEDGGDDGLAFAATVSGTTPSFGSEATFTTDKPRYVDACSPQDDDRFVVVYRNDTGTAGEAVAGTLSGTTITFGSATDFNPTSGDVAHPGCTFTSATDFVVAYEDVANSQQGTSAYCSVDWGTRAVTCNTDEVFFTGTEGAGTNGGRAIGTLSGYSTTAAKIFISYVKDADGDDGEAIVGDLADNTAPADISDLSITGVSSSSIIVSWTSPGDDGSTGTATSYDLRYATTTITGGNFSSAQQATGEPAPLSAGTTQTSTITGLSSSTLYFFALRTSDEVPNTSNNSNVVSTTTSDVLDTTAPAAVANLAVASTSITGAYLTWTAPGDDGSSGIATSYNIRYATSTITSSTFSSATEATGEPTPSVNGSSEGFEVTGLTADTTYYFALQTSDEVPNTSDISNVPSDTTLPSPDTTPPAAISDLDGVTVTEDSVTLTWTSPGDDGSTGTANTYDLRYSTSTINSSNFDSAAAATGEPTPLVSGTTQTSTVSGLTSSTTYYFAIKALDEAANSSTISNVYSTTTITTADLTAPDDVSDLVVASTSITGAYLTWTAPGDDGSTGTADSYDLRYSTSIITGGNFGSATAVSGEPSPSTAGSSEGFEVTGLSANTTYYFALQTSDEVPNTSDISNVPSSSTLPSPDTTPPSAVSNLSITSIGTSTAELSWNAPGDDGPSGTATSYDIRFSILPITAGNFNSASAVTGEPTPLVGGTVQTSTVSNLSPGTTYYFAIKATDEAGNTGTISNTPSDTTEQVGGEETIQADITESNTRSPIAAARAFFAGLAYPGSTIEILRRAGVTGKFASVPFTTVDLEDDGSFIVGLENFLQADYFFALRAIDKNGLKSALFSFPRFFRSGYDFSVRNIVFAPTITTNPKVVSQGSDFTVEGSSAPGATIEIEFNGVLSATTQANESGEYSYATSSGAAAPGRYTLRARQVLEDDRRSSFSSVFFYTITRLAAPEGDFNRDNKINIADWSIFLFRWGSGDQDLQQLIDLNNDDQVNIEDLSVFLRSMSL